MPHVPHALLTLAAFVGAAVAYGFAVRELLRPPTQIIDRRRSPRKRLPKSPSR